MAKKQKKVNLTSPNLGEERLNGLRKILPEVFSEQKIDWDKLKTVLGGVIAPQFDKFSFNWSGKAQAIQAVIEPSKATLKSSKKESVKFDKSKNLFIEGDNLEVLKLLQKTYFEQIKMIYIDPPYNTGGDFVYKDNFTSPIDNYLKQTGQLNGNGEKLETNKETNGRFHSDWLSMIYPRLKLAWNLLKDDGVIFVSIDDNEVHHLRIVMDEIFGEENFVGNFIRQSKVGGGSDSKFIVKEHEYCFCYAKNIDILEEFFIDHTSEYLKRYKEVDENGKYFWDTLARGGLKNPIRFEVEAPDGTKLIDNWNRSQRTFYNDLARGEIKFQKNRQGKWNIYFKQRLNESGKKPRSLTSDLGSTIDGKNDTKEIFNNDKIFSYPKPVKLIQFLINIVSKASDEDIVLDFFSGSGTTAQAVLELNQENNGNRKFICVQLPEKTDEKSEAYKAGYKTIADIAKERIRRVIKGYGKEPKPINNGFKVFKLDKSNYIENNFEFDPEKGEVENKKAYLKYLNDAKQSSLFDKTSELDVIYENIVKEGLSLNSKIEEQKIRKNTIFHVHDGKREFFICLDQGIEKETVKELTNKNYKDKLFICIDDALNDTTKSNLSLNLEIKTI